MRAALLLVLATGCTAYEYEEEVFLEIDGSGEIRMSGSAAAIEALHELDEVTLETASSLFAGEGVEVLSARETERERRKFLHVVARFSAWEKLCELPAYHGRRSRFEKGEGGVTLSLSLPSPRGTAPESVDPNALLALRYHFPSTIRHHNSADGVERGNILSWERTMREHFAGRPLSLEVRFDQRTILATTLWIVSLALVLVVASISAAIFLMVREGRRQLRSEAIAGYPSRFGHPSDG
jgi:hypothetical protein